MRERDNTVCLCMTIEDDAPLLRRALDSVRQLIDCWVIVDTGSAQETPKIIREHLRDIPGELHELTGIGVPADPSTVFGLAKGRAEYLFWLDADEAVDLDEGFSMPQLSADAYTVQVRHLGVAPRARLVRAALEWRCEEGACYGSDPFREPRTERLLTGLEIVRERDRKPLPLISCLMVTLDRFELAQRAIRSYGDQTYPNRELIIVTDGGRAFRGALERFVEQQEIEGVRFVYPSGENLPLGMLRNISLDAANGEIVCQWDDDDVSYPTRLILQAEHMLRCNARGCFLADHLQFILDDRILYWVDWTKEGSSTGASRMAPGTGMMYRDVPFRYPETGPKARQGEDSVLLFSLYEAVPLALLSKFGYLYLYQYHGRNTYSREHHEKLSKCRSPNSWLNENEGKLRAALTYYNIPSPTVVSGRDGPAFTFGI